MKNKIIIVGNDNFTREAYIKGKFVVYPKKKYLNQLMEENEVVNISSPSLTTTKSINMIKAFIETQDFDYCIVSLGKADENNGLNAAEIENNLQILINMLISRGIVPVLCNPYNYEIDTQLCTIVERVKNKFNLKTTLNSLGLKTQFA